MRAAIPVETVPARVQSMDEVIGGSGTVEQSNTVVLTGQLEAQVLEVSVKLGDLVKKGQPLGRWDDRLIQATLQSNRQSVDSNNLKVQRPGAAAQTLPDIGKTEDGLSAGGGKK